MQWLTAGRALAGVRWLAFALAVTFVTISMLPLIYTLLPGNHTARDFVSFWAASKLVLQGRPLAAYDTAAHTAVQVALYPSPPAASEAFFYPPLFLLFCVPLALLPVIPSAVLWLAGTTAAYWATLRRVMPIVPGRHLAILAYPPVFLNGLYGQNGCLTAALFGGGVGLLATRPVWAGLCFGCLAMKPQLGLAIPVALIAARSWRAFVAAAVTVAVLVGTATAAFGVTVWPVWWRQAVIGQHVLDAGAMGIDKLVSVFAALRVLGAGPPTAYAGQAAVTIVVCAVLVWQMRATRRLADRRDRAWLQGAAMVAAVPFCTPFVLDYDLVMLAIPLAVLFRFALRDGFLPGERGWLAGLFLAPLPLKIVTGALGWPVMPLEVLALSACVARRVLASCSRWRDSSAMR